METYFAVPWIEVEYGWGDRPEGFKIFDNENDCISSTIKSSDDGNYKSGGGYFGPERPLHYYKIVADLDIPTGFPIFKDDLKFADIVSQQIPIKR